MILNVSHTADFSCIPTSNGEQSGCSSLPFFSCIFDKKILNQLRVDFFYGGGKQFVVCPPLPEFSGYITENGHATLFVCTAETELKIWCTELLITQFRGTEHIMDIIFFVTG